MICFNFSLLQPHTDFFDMACCIVGSQSVYVEISGTMSELRSLYFRCYISSIHRNHGCIDTTLATQSINICMNAVTAIGRINDSHTSLKLLS